MTETLDLFQLKDGRYIASSEISDKMYRLKTLQPETLHQDSTGYSLDESGMADLFAELYADNTRYCPERKSWYTYSEGAWRKDVDALLVSAKLQEFARLLVLYCGEITDDDKRQAFLKFVTRIGDRRFRDRIRADACSDLAISASAFDSNPYLINCLNGTYDLSTGRFREHDRNDFLTFQTAFSYTLQQGVTAPRWTQFIREVTEGDADKADYLQRALGYSMIGTSDEECMFILHGKTTRNGKSTLLNTVTHMLGDYATVSPVSIICHSDQSKNAESASPTLARLKGTRFVSMAESNQYGRLDEEAIKQLTGGEEITARNLYEAQMTYLPQFTLWLSCNDLPAVQDKSLFASDRVRVIEFNRHFSASERDVTLKDHFRQPDVMMGIFTWLINGYRKYKDRGLKMSPKMQAVIDRYESSNDYILLFLNEKTEKVNDGTLTKQKTVYDAYKVWCKSNGFHSLNISKFIAGLEGHPEKHDGILEDNGDRFIKNLVMKG